MARPWLLAFVPSVFFGIHACFNSTQELQAWALCNCVHGQRVRAFAAPRATHPVPRCLLAEGYSFFLCVVVGGAITSVLFRSDKIPMDIGFGPSLQQVWAGCCYPNAGGICTQPNAGWNYSGNCPTQSGGFLTMSLRFAQPTVTTFTITLNNGLGPGPC